MFDDPYKALGECAAYAISYGGFILMLLLVGHLDFQRMTNINHPEVQENVPQSRNVAKDAQPAPSVKTLE